MYEAARKRERESGRAAQDPKRIKKKQTSNEGRGESPTPIKALLSQPWAPNAKKKGLQRQACSDPSISDRPVSTQNVALGSPDSARHAWLDRYQSNGKEEREREREREKKKTGKSGNERLSHAFCS